MQHKYIVILCAALVLLVAVMNGYDIRFDEGNVELTKKETETNQFRIRPESNTAIHWGIKKKEGEDAEIIFEMEKQL